MQLSRMRGMTAMYHRRFFLDVNITTVLILVLFVVGWWGVEQAFLLVPVVALIGAVQTAFDSSYLVFARWYASYLERYLNERVGERIHVAAELEDAYLFELGTPKIVTIPIGGGFTWFSYVTIFYTVIGAFAYLFGLVLGWDTLMAAPLPVILLYSLGLYRHDDRIVARWHLVVRGRKRRATASEGLGGSFRRAALHIRRRRLNRTEHNPRGEPNGRYPNCHRNSHCRHVRCDCCGDDHR